LLITLKINHNHFQLHPSGSIYWQEKKTLLIADVHLGKVTHFRKYGSAVPQSLIHKNFELLDDVIIFFNPMKICFLGDLFHSSINKEWLFFEQWRKKHASILILLIIGNHDIILHPGIEIKNIGKQRSKLACFYQKPLQMVLPAFGVFTGKHIISPTAEDFIYAISDNEVLLIDSK